MAEDLDAELEDYWKGSEEEDTNTTVQTGGKRVVSLVGKKKAPTPTKKSKVITLKAKKQGFNKALNTALTPQNDTRSQRNQPKKKTAAPTAS